MYTIQKNTKGPTTQNESKPRNLRLSPKCISHTKKVYITKSLQSKTAREGGDASAQHCSLPPKTMPRKENKIPTPGKVCKESGEPLSKVFANNLRRTNPRRNKSLGGGRRFLEPKALVPPKAREATSKDGTYEKQGHLEGWNRIKPKPSRRMG